MNVARYPAPLSTQELATLSEKEQRHYHAQRAAFAKEVEAIKKKAKETGKIDLTPTGHQGPPVFMALPVVLERRARR